MAREDFSEEMVCLLSTKWCKDLNMHRVEREGECTSEGSRQGITNAKDQGWSEKKGVTGQKEGHCDLGSRANRRETRVRTGGVNRDKIRQEVAE